MDVVNIAVTVVLGLAAILVSLMIGRRQIDFVSVDYDVDSDISLWQADADDAMASKIELRYEDRELRHPRFIDVTVKNTGTKPVRREDFDRPIVFQLAGNIAPIDARITEQNPEDIVDDDIFEVQPNGVRAIAIRPRLFNQGAYFKLRMLFNHADAKLEASHHIVGAGPMRRYSVDQLRAQIRFTKRPMIVGYLIAFVIGASVMVKLVSHDIAKGGVGSPVFSMVAGALLGGVGAGMVAVVLIAAASAVYMKFFYH